MRLGYGWEIAMVMLDGPIAEGSSYAPAIFGLAGSLVGGFIAGSVSLLVARQARAASEGAWIRDNRRTIYERFLTCAEKLLHACQAYKRALGDKDEAGNIGAAKASLESAFTNFFKAYGVVQTVAGMRLVEATRIHAYRLWELEESLHLKNVIDSDNFNLVTKLIREARHDMIDAMRAELGLDGGIRPAADYNPFAGTEWEEKYAKAGRARPGQFP